jgi:ferredoxin
LSGAPGPFAAPSAGYHPALSLEPRRRMPHIIAEPCIATKDSSCVEVCPVDCIHPTKNEPEFETAEQLFIDPDTCIDCGLCVDECPVKAIYPQEDLPGEWNKYIQLNLEYYKK